MSSPRGRTWRIRDRRTFEALRRRGCRARRGPVTVTFLADGAELPPRVAYAVGTRVGSAVVRNRVRRRLRAGITARHQGPQGPLPSGDYLVSVGPGAVDTSWAALRSDLDGAIDAATTRGTAVDGDR